MIMKKALATLHWTFFEIRTVEESYSLELQPTRFAGNGNVEGARKLLIGFVTQKTDTAMAVGRQMQWPAGPENQTRVGLINYLNKEIGHVREKIKFKYW